MVQYMKVEGKICVVDGWHRIAASVHFKKRRETYEMRCPMLNENQVWDEGERGKPADRCIEAECAWWNKQWSVCAIAVAANSLCHIDNSMPRLLFLLEGKTS